MSIASNLKAQLVGQLLQTLASAQSAPGGAGAKLAATQATNLAALQNGQLLQAVVTGSNGKDSLNLLVNGIPLTADLKGTALPAQALQPGATLRLKVDAAGEVPRLAFQAVSALASSSKGTPSPIGETTQIKSAIAVAIVSEPEQSPPAKPVLAPASLSQMITRTVSEAAARQGSAAPLYADLAAITKKPESGLPTPLLKLAEALLVHRIDGEKPVAGNDIRQALSVLGLGQPTSPDEGRPQQDIRALLQSLRDTLQTSDKLPLRIVADQEPPRRDSPVSAHRPVAASITKETDPQVIGAIVSREADQAIERMRLHQIASLPEQPVLPETNQSQNALTRQISFELPIAFGQQTAMAGFRIERDRKSRNSRGEPLDVWGIRFAIDADVLGPVHAHLRLAGNNISVSLWAEAPDTHRFFVEAMPLLEAALSENALEIGDINIFSGKPAELRPPASGHFLDRRS